MRAHGGRFELTKKHGNQRILGRRSNYVSTPGPHMFEIGTYKYAFHASICALNKGYPPLAVSCCIDTAAELYHTTHRRYQRSQFQYLRRPEDAGDVPLDAMLATRLPHAHHAPLALFLAEAARHPRATSGFGGLLGGGAGGQRVARRLVSVIDRNTSCRILQYSF